MMEGRKGMKGIKVPENIYLDKYDIHVKPYLSYAEIQTIVNGVSVFDTWSERQQNIDILALFYCTDIGKDKIEEVGHEALYNCGIIDAVRACIYNYNLIEEALNYTEGLNREVRHIMNDFRKIASVGDKKKK